MPSNNLKLIGTLLERGVPMNRGEQDLHHIQVLGPKAIAAWKEENGDLKPLATVYTCVDHQPRMDLAVYETKDEMKRREEAVRNRLLGL